VSHTIVAADDSVTMRKVLEITFSGTDLKCVTAASADAAMERVKADRPQVVIADVSMDPKTGYDLCAAVKQAAPGTRVLILSSKHNPYDAARGTAVGADDHMDKPFDTQQMLDRVKKLIEAKPEAAPAPAPAPVAGRQATQPSIPALQPPTPPARAKTLMFGHGGGANVPNFVPNKPAPMAGATPPPAKVEHAVAKAAPTPPTGVAAVAAAPAPRPAAPAHTAAAAPVVAHLVDEKLAKKLDEVGLTPAQVDAVLALSREVIERVVWEVVPVLAETIIKEELARLTK
jgi:CheY-like chemotaxis protein